MDHKLNAWYVQLGISGGNIGAAAMRLYGTAVGEVWWWCTVAPRDGLNHLEQGDVKG